MIARLVLVPCLVLTALSACSRTDNEPGPGGVTVSEAKALDDAAAMLESRNTPDPTDPNSDAKDQKER